MGSKKTSKESSSVIIMNGKPFDIPPGGTLGILALGNVGIRAWKKAKEEWLKSNTDDKKEK